MSTFYKVLQDNFKLLQNEFPQATLENIFVIDILETDGMATEAKFKIVVSQHDIFLTTVYVRDDGGWFMTADSILVKKALKTWIESVKTI